MALYVKIVISILIGLLGMASQGLSQQPYSGTIFIDPDIIMPSDRSALQNALYSGQGFVTMYDRRVPGWVTVNAFLFDITWDDGLSAQAQINAEFSTVSEATFEAEKYGFLIGQLPTCLREDVDEIWIHKGTEPFGGGNNSILIHTGQGLLYENDSILEETLAHEASHTSLDATHSASPGWLNAQSLDPDFISSYAFDNPTREDIAESFLPWLAIRHRPARISSQDFTTITTTIPNRIIYFDSIACPMYPIVGTNSLVHPSLGIPQIKYYPNPTQGKLYLEIPAEFGAVEVWIRNITGQTIHHQYFWTGEKVELQLEGPQGLYWVELIAEIGATVLKVMKE